MDSSALVALVSLALLNVGMLVTAAVMLFGLRTELAVVRAEHRALKESAAKRESEDDETMLKVVADVHWLANMANALRDRANDNEHELAELRHRPRETFEWPKRERYHEMHRRKT